MRTAFRCEHVEGAAPVYLVHLDPEIFPASSPGPHTFLACHSCACLADDRGDVKKALRVQS